MFHGGGWWAYLSYDEKRGGPSLSWSLFKRVWSYAKPYHLKTLGLLVTIFVITGLSLIPPLLYRDFIDNALPNGDVTRLNWLALGMIAIPIVSAGIGLGQRYLSATIGESLIADLRNSLYNHLQHLSLRFFTQIKTSFTYSCVACIGLWYDRCCVQSITILSSNKVPAVKCQF
jgi:ATP-binding cassette, subfamily B, bacterial